MSEWFSAKIQEILFDFNQSFIEDDRWLYIVKGLRVTITVAICALILGVIIGIIVAVIRSAHDQKRGKKNNFSSLVLGILDFLCRIYLTVIRGTPMMVQLLIMYFVIFTSTTNTELVAILAFGINSGAYVAEIIRGGIMSIDAGQMEAGRSLGLNYVKTMRFIIVPQAIKNILPALGNEMITLLKDTSLVTVIGLKDMVKGALIIQGRTYQAFMPLVVVAIIYLVLVIILSKILSMFERRMRESDRR